VTSQSLYELLPMDTPITGGIGLLDIVIRNLRAIFPGSLLIPVPRGVDPRDVPLPLLTEVDTPAFQS
jgi:hypothetical protein